MIRTMELSGANVLITGATGGLGQTIATAISAAGGRVILTGRRAEVLEPLAAKLGGVALAADLSDHAGVTALLAEAGEVDVLVANAAIPGTGVLSEYSVEEIDRALEVNLRAPIVLARLVAEQMIPRRRGHLVFVNSLAGKAASGGSAMYNCTKFGLRGFALALREDLRPYDIGVSSIFPGFIRDAGMFADAGVKLPRGLGTRTPADVATALLRAVHRDIAEVDVAPLTLRLGTLFGALAPSVSASVQRRAGAADIAAALGEAQRDKR